MAVATVIRPRISFLFMNLMPGILRADLTASVNSPESIITLPMAALQSAQVSFSPCPLQKYNASPEEFIERRSLIFLVYEKPVSWFGA
jgi:hypothetical protein